MSGKSVGDRVREESVGPEREGPKMGRSAWIASAAVWVVSLVPHFFFATPFELHMHGEDRAWIAIAIWSPAILAAWGVAQVEDLGVRLGAVSGRIRGAWASLLILMMYAAFLGLRYQDLWMDMPRTPWEELGKVALIVGAMRAAETFFWQGLVQARLLAAVRPVVRVFSIAVFVMLIGCPFALSIGWAAALGAMSTLFVEGALVALAFETGLRLRWTMLLRGAMGVAFVWFQQALLL